MNTTPTFHHTAASVLFRAAAIQGHRAQFHARLMVLMHLAGHAGYRRHIVMIMRALATMERRIDK